MAAYDRVYDYVTCGLTAKRLGSAPSTMLVNRLIYLIELTCRIVQLLVVAAADAAEITDYIAVQQ